MSSVEKYSAEPVPGPSRKEKRALRKKERRLEKKAQLAAGVLNKNQAAVILNRQKRRAVNRAKRLEQQASLEEGNPGQQSILQKRAKLMLRSANRHHFHLEAYNKRPDASQRASRLSNLPAALLPVKLSGVSVPSGSGTTKGFNKPSTKVQHEDMD